MLTQVKSSLFSMKKNISTVKITRPFLIRETVKMPSFLQNEYGANYFGT